MNLICPHCGLQGRTQEEAAGKKFRCPKCHKVIRVKAAATATVIALQIDGICSKCGFRFDDTFSEKSQHLTTCSICGRMRPLT